MRVLVVHGVSHKEVESGWPQKDFDALNEALAFAGGARPEVEFFMYDDDFARAKINFETYVVALRELVPSLLFQGVGDFLNRPRSMFNFLTDRVRWTAGMVAQWSVDAPLRKKLRTKLSDQIARFNPDVVVAHSMGSLICYDLFTEAARGADAVKGRIFVTLGSQIENPALRKLFGGRLQHLDSAKHWYNLYNKNDNVLVADITLQYDGFTRVQTPFTEDAPFHHAWEQYVLHTAAIANVWEPLALPQPSARVLARELKVKPSEYNEKVATAVMPPDRRALLIGINNYPNAEDRLEGCVNDVFQMSAALQECGFAADDIRVVLDDRATAEGIRERLDWLLDGVKDGDRRLLFYSGHGTRIPTYGSTGVVEGFVEALVPCDFDFTPDKMITDHDLMCRYANLPYDSYFAMILDCCHSGGLTRDGGPKVRGVSLPDDIRHRMLKWDIKRQMWVPRDFKPLLEGLSNQDRDRFTGTTGSSMRLGRATPLRSKTSREYDRIRAEKGTKGPYMPTILTACKEEQFSYEYRHGVTSYGAFTYAVIKLLKEVRNRGTNPTFEDLIKETGQLLAELKYDQAPQIAGPTETISGVIPWTLA